MVTTRFMASLRCSMRVTGGFWVGMASCLGFRQLQSGRARNAKILGHDRAPSCPLGTTADHSCGVTGNSILLSLCSWPLDLGVSRRHLLSPASCVVPDLIGRPAPLRRRASVTLSFPRDRKSTRLNSSHLGISY